MKVTRLSDVDRLEQFILARVHKQISHTPKDGVWRTFKGTVKMHEYVYKVSLDFMLTGDMFHFENKKIELNNHKEEEHRIILPKGMTR